MSQAFTSQSPASKEGSLVDILATHLATCNGCLPGWLICHIQGHVHGSIVGLIVGTSLPTFGATSWNTSGPTNILAIILGCILAHRGAPWASLGPPPPPNCGQTSWATFLLTVWAKSVACCGPRCGRHRRPYHLQHVGLRSRPHAWQHPRPHHGQYTSSLPHACCPNEAS